MLASNRLTWITMILLLAAACSPATPTAPPTPPPPPPPTPAVVAPTATAADAQSEPTATLQPAPTTPEGGSADATATLAPTFAVLTATATWVPWQDLPVIPEVSERAREIYRRGLEMGRNPNAFAKVGDCGGTPSWFLGPFDGPADQYRLGDYAYLQETIEHFAGSFGRISVATRPGFNVASIFAPLWADPAQCKPGEGPLICEIRLTNASFALVMMGTNDWAHKEDFESQMRRAMKDLMDRGVVPIMMTKADNVEQDNSINAAIARLAREYDVPLWNFWAAAQPLPNSGLEEDGAHLTWAGNRFDDPKAMSRGWPVRNLTALQALDAVWRGVTNDE